jgi:predicted RNA binding protein YcfA (HicA-like mRNA interferase family)
VNPKLPAISGREAIEVFTKAGWEIDRQKGSHVIVKKEGSIVSLSIPLHRELAPGTLRSLIRAASMTIEDFCDLL